MFEREDWTLFRTTQTLCQKAGVSPELLPRLVAKELADNALDASGCCRVGMLLGNGFYVENDGDGIPGTDDELAALFSVRRPLSSSKLRCPSRGALGNGLRVVVGSVLASGGSMQVETGGRCLKLHPQDSGHTSYERVGDSDLVGTRISVWLGPSMTVNEATLSWARTAIRIASGKSRYLGKTSPHWYDSDSFLELLRSSGGRKVRDLVAEFDGCSGPNAGIISANFLGRCAASLDHKESDELLTTARGIAKVVTAGRMGVVGPGTEANELGEGYAKSTGEFTLRAGRGCHAATLPYVVESWAELSDDAQVEIYVNRTPITAPVKWDHRPKDLILAVFGCGLAHGIKAGRKPVKLCLNVETPYMPITSDGKAPDFLPMLDQIVETAEKAVRRARRRQGVPSNNCSAQQSIKNVILANIAEAIRKAGDSGRYRFSLRQLFYVVRPHVIEAFGAELEYGYFGSVITDYEAEHGDIVGMYRDPRGTLYHPHTKQEIPLGTISVEAYRRPEWTFNKILYCEKEGFFPILKDAEWPERNDCALMSAKGFASRAARDVLDMLATGSETLRFFCIHDADAYGTMIYQSLQEATKARPGRKVEIINLGLEPAEAESMGLQVESVNRKGAGEAPVASYVDVATSRWLQSKRVELNSMTTPQFLAWLDRKFTPYGGKVIPPANVLVVKLENEIRHELRGRIMSRLIQKAKVDDRVEREFHKRESMIGARSSTLPEDVRSSLADIPEDQWSEPIRVFARSIARSRGELKPG